MQNKGEKGIKSFLSYLLRQPALGRGGEPVHERWHHHGGACTERPRRNEAEAASEPASGAGPLWQGVDGLWGRYGFRGLRKRLWVTQKKRVWVTTTTPPPTHTHKKNQPSSPNGGVSRSHSMMELVSGRHQPTLKIKLLTTADRSPSHIASPWGVRLIDLTWVTTIAPQTSSLLNSNRF